MTSQKRKPALKADTALTRTVQTLVMKNIGQPDENGVVRLWRFSDTDEPANTERMNALMLAYPTEGDDLTKIIVNGQTYQIDFAADKTDLDTMWVVLCPTEKTASQDKSQTKKSLEELKAWWASGLEKKGIQMMPPDYSSARKPTPYRKPREEK